MRIHAQFIATWELACGLNVEDSGKNCWYSKTRSLMGKNYKHLCLVCTDDENAYTEGNHPDYTVSVKSSRSCGANHAG